MEEIRILIDVVAHAFCLSCFFVFSRGGFRYFVFSVFRLVFFFSTFGQALMRTQASHHSRAMIENYSTIEPQRYPKSA